eukprot:8769580-Pyramimonas_sp.AAC.1
MGAHNNPALAPLPTAQSAQGAPPEVPESPINAGRRACAASYRERRGSPGNGLGREGPKTTPAPQAR